MPDKLLYKKLLYIAAIKVYRKCSNTACFAKWAHKKQMVYLSAATFLFGFK